MPANWTAQPRSVLLWPWNRCLTVVAAGHSMTLVPTFAVGHSRRRNQFFAPWADRRTPLDSERGGVLFQRGNQSLVAARDCNRRFRTAVHQPAAYIYIRLKPAFLANTSHNGSHKNGSLHTGACLRFTKGSGRRRTLGSAIISDRPLKRNNNTRFLRTDDTK